MVEEQESISVVYTIRTQSDCELSTPCRSQLHPNNRRTKGGTEPDQGRLPYQDMLEPHEVAQWSNAAKSLCRRRREEGGDARFGVRFLLPVLQSHTNKVQKYQYKIIIQLSSSTVRP